MPSGVYVRTKKYKMSLEGRRNISLAHIGHKRSKESIEKFKQTIKEKYKKGYVNKLKGRSLSKETKDKISKSLKGNKNCGWSKGLKLGPQSKERRDKISNALLGKKKSLTARRNMSIAAKGKVLSEETKKKMSYSRKGYIVSKQTSEKIALANTGKKLSLEHRKKLSLARMGKPPSNKGVPKSEKTKKKLSEKIKNQFENCRVVWNKGVPMSEKAKEKCRKWKIKYIEDKYNNGLPITPVIGNNETQILDWFEKDLGIKIIRQYKVVGYFVDGYCKEKNIVFEVDEEHHKNQIEKDKIRQENIIKELNCRFIRLTEKYWS